MPGLFHVRSLNCDEYQTHGTPGPDVGYTVRMGRFANLAIVRLLVGGSAVAITYIGLPAVLLHFGIPFFAPFLLHYFGESNNVIQTGSINVSSAPNTEACLGIMRTLVYLGVALAAIAVYRVYAGVLEKRTLTEFSRRGMAQDVRNGVLIPLFVFAIAIFVPLSLRGNLVIEGINAWPVVPPIFGLAVMSAVCEEIFFRGVLFRIIESSLGSLVAVLLSSLLFGAAHYFNPGATLLGAVGIGLEAGLALSALYMLTRRLWVCISMHFTWNLINGLLGSRCPDSG